MIEGDPIDDTFQRFLTELDNQSGGDRSAQVSMYDVGRALGLEKDQAGHMAEELIGMGLVEIRTLSGAIGITTAGQSQVRLFEDTPPESREQLGPGPVMDANDAALIERLVLEIKKAVEKSGLVFDALDELTVDLRTIDAQMMSPRPKTVIIKACLQSIGGTLRAHTSEKLAQRVRKLATA